MAAVDGSYANLLQGMSQQPPQTRAEGQCELQVNMIADPVNDLRKRPPSDYINILNFASDSKTYKYHEYNRGDEEKYLIAIGNQEVVVYDLEGNSYPVSPRTDYSYLSSSNPLRDFKLTTVGDITVIANSSVATQEDTVTTSSGVSETTVEIKGGAWATVYTISWKRVSDGVTGITEYRTPSGVGRTVDSNGNPLDPIDPELDADKLKPSSIAASLASQLASDTGITGIAAQISNLLSIGSGIEVTSVTDGRGNQFIIHAGDRVDDVSDLPATSKQNRVVEVSPTDNNTATYYVRFDTTGDYSEGVWKECPAPGSTVKWVQNSMPHGLIRLQDVSGNIYFQFTDLDDEHEFTNYLETYKVPYWTRRKVGDEESNPFPSFTGNPITDIGTFQNRLYFVSGESIIFSTADEYWDFFYTSAVDVIDSDPIDFTATTGQVNIIKQSTMLDGDLVLFSDNAQFIVPGSKPLTPSSAFISPITFFESKNTCKPISSGRSVFFPISHGIYSGIRELQTDAISATRDAPPLTAHVAKLIQGDVNKLTSADESGMMLLSTLDFDNRLYTYEYVWSGEQKIQSAWSYWEYADNFSVVYHFNIKTSLYVILKDNKSGLTYMVTHSLEDFVETSFGFNLYLDNVVELQTYDTDKVDLPYTYSEVVIIQGDGSPYPGMLAGVYTNEAYDGAGTTVALGSDLRGGKVFAGIRYTSKFTPTRPYVKDSKGTPITTGSLTVSRFVLSYRDSGYIKSTLNSKYGETVEGLLTGRVLGELENKVGTTPIVSGTVNIPVLQSPENAEITIESDDYRPVVLTDLEWEGQFSKNKRRI